MKQEHNEAPLKVRILKAANSTGCGCGCGHVAAAVEALRAAKERIQVDIDQLQSIVRTPYGDHSLYCALKYAKVLDDMLTELIGDDDTPAGTEDRLSVSEAARAEQKENEDKDARSGHPRVISPADPRDGQSSESEPYPARSRRDWLGLAAWMRAPGTINKDDAIDECARAVENFAEYQFLLDTPERSLAGTATTENRSAGARDASRSESTDSGTNSLPQWAVDRVDRDINSLLVDIFSAGHDRRKHSHTVQVAAAAVAQLLVAVRAEVRARPLDSGSEARVTPMSESAKDKPIRVSVVEATPAETATVDSQRVALWDAILLFASVTVVSARKRKPVNDAIDALIKDQQQEIEKLKVNIAQYQNNTRDLRFQLDAAQQEIQRLTGAQK